MSRLRAAVAGILAATTLMGCSGPVAGDASPSPAGDRGEPSGPALPPRPQEIPVDDIDPCGLLTPDQVDLLGLHSAQFEPATDEIGPSCRWVHSPYEPIGAYLVALDTDFGIETILGNSRGITTTSIAGFPAVETESEKLLLPGTQCIVAIDVAPGQVLQLNYSYSGVLPTTRELACEKARPVAEMAMQNLIEMAGG